MSVLEILTDLKEELEPGFKIKKSKIGDVKVDSMALTDVLTFMFSGPVKADAVKG